MTRHKQADASVGIRDVIRCWPVVLVVTLIALSAAIWSEGQQSTSYTATTRLVIVPLAQWDETFIGISLLRDAGDATRTATTAAAQLGSSKITAATADYLAGDWTPELVAASVKVTAVDNTNMIDITAKSSDPNKATKLSEGYAEAVLAERWQTISGELDARIAAIQQGGDLAGQTADANTAAGRLQTLKAVRDAGSDPTARIDSTSLPVRDKHLSFAALLALGAVGGLFLGVLAAIGVAMVRRRMESSGVEPSTPPYSLKSDDPANAHIQSLAEIN